MPSYPNIDVWWEDTEVEKNYTGPIFQKGKPILSADLNVNTGLILKAISDLYYNIVGDGVVEDSYQIQEITPLEDNNFTIKGMANASDYATAFAEGRKAQLFSDVNYNDQIYLTGTITTSSLSSITDKYLNLHNNEVAGFRLKMTSGSLSGAYYTILSNTSSTFLFLETVFSGQEGETFEIYPPALSTPVATRDDIVYLDISEQKISSRQDSNIILSAYGRETSWRRKNRPFILVREGSTVLPTPIPGHSVIALAYLHRTTSTSIEASMIEDIRRVAISDKMADITSALELNFVLDKQQGNKTVIPNELNELEVTKTNTWEYTIDTGIGSYDGRAIEKSSAESITYPGAYEEAVGDYSTKTGYESHTTGLIGEVTQLNNDNLVPDGMGPGLTLIVTDTLDTPFSPGVDFSINASNGTFTPLTSIFENKSVRCYYKFSEYVKVLTCLDPDGNAVFVTGAPSETPTVPATNHIVLAETTLAPNASFMPAPTDSRKFMHSFMYGEDGISLDKDAIDRRYDQTTSIRSDNLYRPNGQSIEEGFEQLIGTGVVFEREILSGTPPIRVVSTVFSELTKIGFFSKNVPKLKTGYDRFLRFHIYFIDLIGSLSKHDTLHFSIRDENGVEKKKFKYTLTANSAGTYFISDAILFNENPDRLDDWSIWCCINNFDITSTGSLFDFEALFIQKMEYELIDIKEVDSPFTYSNGGYGSIKYV